MRIKAQKLKIAVQKDGRISSLSLEMLKKADVNIYPDPNRLFASASNFELEVLFLRSSDIGSCVEQGICDAGIVGLNRVKENGGRLKVIQRLGFGECRLSIAVPVKSRIRDVKDLAGQRIATSYPVSLRRFLARQKIEAEIITISGSVEILPVLGAADCLCDIVSTGTTLREHGLRELTRVYSSQAVLVGGEKSLAGAKQQMLEQLAFRLKGCAQAVNSKYLMMNINKADLAKARKILPGLKSPTIMPLADPAMIAVHSVVPRAGIWEKIDRLKQAGASGILVTSLEKIIY